MLWRWIFFNWKCPSSWKLVFSHNFMLKPSSYFKKRTFLKSGASVFTHFFRTTGNLLTTIFYLENKISSIVTIYRHGWTWNLHTLLLFENIRKPPVFYVFKWYRNEILTWNGLWLWVWWIFSEKLFFKIFLYNKPTAEVSLGTEVLWRRRNQDP